MPTTESGRVSGDNEFPDLLALLFFDRWIAGRFAFLGIFNLRKAAHYPLTRGEN